MAKYDWRRGLDQLSSLELTVDGGYIISVNPSQNISGEKAENSKGGNDYWIIKLNALGYLEWQKYHWWK